MHRATKNKQSGAVTIFPTLGLLNLPQAACFFWLAPEQEEMAADDKPVPSLQPSLFSYNVQAILQLPGGREGWQWYDTDARELC